MPKIRTLLRIMALAAIGFVGYAWYADDRGAVDDGNVDGPLQVAGTKVDQGTYLVAAADCVGCHTSPGGAAFAGGVPFRLPFGTIYSTNLTPDPTTGIGSWSDEEFLRAVRGGVSRGGRHLYPAHPYTSYAGMARNDVLAIKAYLASLPPVANQVQSSDLRFPYSQRWLMVLWNSVFLSNSRLQPDAGHDAEWNRGLYLATALGHCGECHTPRNAAYALRKGNALSGAITQGWKAYDITAGPTGLGDWTEAAISEYLATGHADGHGTAAGPMKEVVAYSTSRLLTEDRAALVRYLVAGRVSTETNPPTVAKTPGVGSASGAIGAPLYAGTCAGCHSLDPTAAAGPYSNLGGARTVRDPEGTNVLKLISEGSPHGGAVGTSMPNFGQAYSDTERAALANFVLARWGHITPALTPNDAQRARLRD